jgi:hypothetical protein
VYYHGVSCISLAPLRVILQRRYNREINKRMNPSSPKPPRNKEPRYFGPKVILQHTIKTGAESVLAIHTGERTVTFLPSWDMTASRDAALISDPMIASEAMLKKKGVRIIDYSLENPLFRSSAVQYGYTLFFMETYCKYPPRVDKKALLAILADVSRLSYTAFMRRFFPYDPNITQAEREELATRAAQTSTRWTFEEDTAIKTLYRPWITLSEERKLYEVCKNRRKSVIAQRARELRLEMIEAGVYTVSDLPHRRYNANIRKEINSARRRAVHAKRREQEQ